MFDEELVELVEVKIAEWNLEWIGNHYGPMATWTRNILIRLVKKRVAFGP